MAADLHIHVLEGCTERDYARFQSNTIGSKFFNPQRANREWDDLFTKISATPGIWIGQVSWLKAAFMEGGEEVFVPGPVQTIQRLIGEEFPVLDDALAEKILDALRIENKTGYSITEVEPVREFLNGHRGKRLFTVSW